MSTDKHRRWTTVLDMRARYLADQGWSAEDVAAVLGTSPR